MLSDGTVIAVVLDGRKPEEGEGSIVIIVGKRAIICLSMNTVMVVVVWKQELGREGGRLVQLRY